MNDVKKRGGLRPGSGRKKGEGSSVVRVPDGILLEVKRLIDTYKSTPEPPKASKSTPEPPKASKSTPEPPKASKSTPEPPKASVRLVCNDLEDATKNPMFDWKVKPMSSQKRAKAKALRKKKRKK